MKETVRAHGHENVSARHRSTFEVTTDDYLTPAGDCIIGIGADRAPADFEPALIDRCRTDDATLVATLAVGDVTCTVRGGGHPDLTFSSDRSMVFRTSDYVDGRTVMIRADAAARDLDRALVDRLSRGQRLRVTLQVG